MKDLIQEGRNLYQSFKHRMVENSGVISMDEPYIKDMDRFVKAIVSNFQKYAKRSKLQNVTVGVPIRGKYQTPFSDEELEYNVWIPITFDGKKYVFQFYVNQTDFRKYLSYVDREKSTKEVSDNGPVFKRVEMQNNDPSKEVFAFIQNRAEWEKGSGGAYKAHFESRHTRNTSPSFERMNEDDGRYKNFFERIFDDLDVNFKTLKFDKVYDTNKVAQYLQDSFMKAKGRLSNNTAMSIATDYSDYRKGLKSKDEAISAVLKTMEPLKKSTSLSEGKRRYKLGYNIGKSKYVISFHDGNSKHKDGSDFFDVKIFQNKNQFNSAIQDLEKQGYVEE